MIGLIGGCGKRVKFLWERSGGCGEVLGLGMVPKPHPTFPTHRPLASLVARPPFHMLSGHIIQLMACIEILPHSGETFPQYWVVERKRGNAQDSGAAACPTTKQAGAMPSHPFLYLAHQYTAHRQSERTSYPREWDSVRLWGCELLWGRSSDELWIRAASRELPEEGGALWGPRLPCCPDEHLLSPETSFQLRLEKAQGRF